MLLFHHALGLTPGCLSFAERLRSRGHVVHVPDLYDGARFDVLDDGVAHAEHVLGFATVIDRGREVAETLPDGLVYLGMSLGALPAQMLAQTRAGAKGGLLLHSAIPLSEFGGSWPAGVALQIHTMADDGWGDVDVARAIAEAVDEAELHLYPGDRHLFTDDSWSDYDADAAALVERRVLAFLAAVDGPVA